jgi:hypothetical protein
LTLPFETTPEVEQHVEKLHLKLQGLPGTGSHS